jgi:hypothetical protein
MIYRPRPTLPTLAIKDLKEVACEAVVNYREQATTKSMQ